MDTHSLAPAHQSGFGLLESLVAVAVLSGGMLALLSAHNRAQALSRDHQHLTTAISLMQDIGERMHLNRNANGHAVTGYYLSTWEQTHAHATNCITEACTADDWAAADLKAWKAQVARLPQGKAAIQRTGDADDLWVVMVAWQAPQATGSDLTPITAGPALSCPATHRCHISHVLP